MSNENEISKKDFFTKEKYKNSLNEAIESYDETIELLKTSIKKSDDIQDKLGYKTKINDLKINLKQMKKENKQKYNEYLKPIKSKDLLMSADGNHHKNLFKNLSKDNIKEIKDAIRIAKKIKVIKTNDKVENKINVIKNKIEISKIREKMSYNAILKTKILEEKVKFIIHKKNLKNNFKQKYSIELEKRANISKSLRIEAKLKNKEIQKKYFLNLLKLIKLKMLFKVNKISYIEQKHQFKKEYKDLKNILINENEFYLNKINMKYIKAQFKNENRLNRFEYNNSLNDYNDSIPIIWNQYNKWISGFLALVFPGLGQLYSREFKKSIVFLCITPLFLLMFLYAFGIGNIEGQGILGLVSLGHAETLWQTKDARYFVIEGALGVIFFLMAIMYCLFSAFSTFYQNLAMQNGARPNSWLQTKNYLINAGYPIITSIPCILSLIFVAFIPIVTSILLAFTNYGPNNPSNFDWNGFEQFKILFDKDWARTIGYVALWTMLWTFISWFTSFVIAYCLASITNHSRIKGKKIFRILYILPWAIPSFISILVFRLMTVPGGLLSNWIGTDAIQSNATYARVAIIMIQMWMGYCVNYVLITGILQSINSDMYEAVEIDGGGMIQKNFKITLPIVIYQMTPILIGQLIGSFNNFGIIYLFLDGGPYETGSTLTGGAGATDTISSLIFKLISGGNVGKASALNIIVSAVIVTISVTVLVRSKSVKGGQN